MIDHPLLIEIAVTAWERDMRIRLRRSPVEITKSVAFVRRLAAECSWRTVGDISRQHLLGWLTRYIENGGPGAVRTARNHLSRIRSFGRYVTLAELGEPRLDAITLPRSPRRPGASAFSAAEVRSLIARARRRERFNGNASKHGPLASTFYAFLALTGLRFSEAAEQLWQDIELERGAIRITIDKSRRNDRIPLAIEAVELLRAWREFSPGPAVFPHVPSAKTLRRDMARAEIPGRGEGRRGEWHRFRKCAITERARAGANLRDLHRFARHTDVSLTLNCYDDIDLEEVRRAAELMPRLS